MPRQGDEKDVAFIEDPMQWPKWPWLPVKRYSDDYPMPQCGVMVAEEGIRWFVFEAFLTNLPKTRKELMALPRHEYPSAAAVVDDGWMVD